MSLEIVFNGDISAANADKILLSRGGHNIDTSQNTPSINRSDIEIVKTGRELVVGINIATSDLSDETKQSIKKLMPCEYIHTRNA